MEKEEKNNKKQEFKGRNLEEALSHAEHILKIPRTQFNYEIVAEKTKLFGIKTKQIVIRAWPKKETQSVSGAQFLNMFLEKFPLDINYQVRKNGDIYYFIFDGKDKHYLLEKDGSLLLALQHILNKISPDRIQADCDFFRKRKERELKDYVQHIARKVQETGRNETLGYMNPYERRLVHLTANKIEGISTESLGNGFMKKVRIYPYKNSRTT
ncbi:MAG: Jag N-terminal domain-containing protein [Candidatus Aminicenantes bacterium]